MTTERIPHVASHLANDRTSMAWVRTGLALIVLGLFADQILARHVVAGVPLVRGLATTTIAMGAVLTAAAAFRHRRNRHAIDRGDFRPAGLSIVAATIGAFVIGGLSLAFVLLLPGPGAT